MIEDHKPQIPICVHLVEHRYAGDGRVGRDIYQRSDGTTGSAGRRAGRCIAIVENRNGVNDVFQRDKAVVARRIADDRAVLIDDSNRLSRWTGSEHAVLLAVDGRRRRAEILVDFVCNCGLALHKRVRDRQIRRPRECRREAERSRSQILNDSPTCFHLASPKMHTKDYEYAVLCRTSSISCPEARHR